MIAGGLASEVMMIYCYALFDNWQMEKTRCRAREGAKFLLIRTLLTFTVKQKRPHPVLPSAEVMCWLRAALQRLWRQHGEAAFPQPLGEPKVPELLSGVLEQPTLCGGSSPGI